MAFYERSARCLSFSGFLNNHSFELRSFAYIHEEKIFSRQGQQCELHLLAQESESSDAQSHET